MSEGIIAEIEADFGYVPHPGSRLDHLQKSQQQALPESNGAVAEPQQKIKPVLTENRSAAHGTYFTVVIPASSANNPSVQRLLPYDETRTVAYIQSANNTVILTNSKEEAQAPGNAASSVTNPSGYYLANGTAPLPVGHCEEVWAANTSTSAAALIAVAVEKRQNESSA